MRRGRTARTFGQRSDATPPETVLTTDYNTDFEQMTGLERMQHFADHAEERFGVAKWLGYSVVQFGDGAVELRYEPNADHMNLLSTIHGGVLTSLLDTVMGCAVMTTLGPQEKHTIIDLHTKFVRPVTLDTKPLRVLGSVDHRGRRQSTMSGRIVAPGDKLCASATATAMML